MPKFSINATELTGTDVDFVALVKRGANRIPFRLTKGENDMLDLYSIGRRLFKTGEPQPTVVAAIVQKGADVAAIAKTLKSVGVDVSTFVKSEKGGLITFARKSDEPAEDVMLVKMAGGVALAISNVSKSFQGYDFQSPDFGEVHAKGSHVASMSNAADSLHTTMGNILDNAKDPQEASDQMGAACDAHKAHIQALTQKLPTHAFKADQALLKAEVAALLKAGDIDMRKHPHAGVAMAIAHAAHAAAQTAGQAADMISGGTDDDQQTGDGLGDRANGAAKAKTRKDAANIAVGDVEADDPLMPAKDAGKGPQRAAKADAGKNGTGAGFELGDGTGVTDSSTADDAANTEVDAAPGGKTSGTDTGLPAKAKAPTKKAAIAAAHLAVAKAELALALAKDDGDVEDDDSTNGAQDSLPAKAKAPTKAGGVNKTAHTTDVTTQTIEGESNAGEGAAAAMDDSQVSDATADDAENAGGDVTGKVKGKTLDLDGVPAKAKSPTAAGGVNKNDGDAEIGKKGKGNQPDEELSGAGAQEQNVQTLKSDAQLMKAIQALSKSVQESIAGVQKSIEKTNTRVEAVASMAKKTDAALNGTVFNEAEGDNVRAIKSEASKAPPLMDTGYNRRTA